MRGEASSISLGLPEAEGAWETVKLVGGGARKLRKCGDVLRAGETQESTTTREGARPGGAASCWLLGSGCERAGDGRRPGFDTSQLRDIVVLVSPAPRVIIFY